MIDAHLDLLEFRLGGANVVLRVLELVRKGLVFTRLVSHHPHGNGVAATLLICERRLGCLMGCLHLRRLGRQLGNILLLLGGCGISLCRKAENAST